VSVLDWLLLGSVGGLPVAAVVALVVVVLILGRKR
jgi:hypothetical protein